MTTSLLWGGGSWQIVLSVKYTIVLQIQLGYVLSPAQDLCHAIIFNLFLVENFETTFIIFCSSWYKKPLKKWLVVSGLEQIQWSLLLRLLTKPWAAKKTRIRETKKLPVLSKERRKKRKKSQGELFFSLKKILGKPWENPGKTPGKTLGKTQWKPRENPRTTPGKPWKNPRENPGEKIFFFFAQKPFVGGGGGGEG